MSEIGYLDRVQFTYDDHSTPLAIEKFVTGTVIAMQAGTQWSTPWGFSNSPDTYAVLLDPGEVTPTSTWLQGMCAMFEACRADFVPVWGALMKTGDIVAASILSLNKIGGSKTAAQRLIEGTCPKCGDRGYWKSLALFCPIHGMFI